MLTADCRRRIRGPPERPGTAAGTERSRPGLPRAGRLLTRIRARAGSPAVPAAPTRRLPVTAASTASCSYALTASTRPRSSGASGARATGRAPDRSIRAGTSTTQSAGRSGSAPSFRALTTWTSPVRRGDGFHERRSRLRVVRAAAFLEQRRLPIERRVRVQREQLLLDGGHVLRPGMATSLRLRGPRPWRSSSAGNTTEARRVPR